MGISGLLPLLKSIHKTCTLKSFEGKTLGIDAYGWLHRGVIACTMELATGKPTRKFVDFAMNRVRMLQHFGVTPFLVFDGDNIPSKAAIEADRARKRDQSRKAGFNLLNAGKTSQAHLEFQRSLDVTPEMAQQLIEELKLNGVKYIVAPYEADPQMVYLERKGIIDGIISEDSDLLVFGAKCLLTKMDQYGNCIEINKADFSACKEINMVGWSDITFRQMAIMSGCDYLASIHKMGLKTAHMMLRKYKTIERVVQMLRFDGKYHVPKDYLESFRQAELTFLYQRVFCPEIMGLVTHTQPVEPIDLEKMPFIGAFIEPEIAQGIARGDLHPMTKLPIILKRENLVHRKYERALSSSDLEKGIPITSFFRKCTPLAELSPNCFSPPNSQCRVLERYSGEWELMTPVRQRYQPLQKFAAEREHTEDPESRPFKKTRLCTETDHTSGHHIFSTSSRFFGPQPLNLDLQQNGGITGHKRREDTSIFSDDSIDEALLSLPYNYDFEGYQEKSEFTPDKGTQTIKEDINLPHLDVLLSTNDSVDILDLKISPRSLPNEDREKNNLSSTESNPLSLHTGISINQNSDNKPQLESRKSQVALANNTISSPLKTSTKMRLTSLQRISIYASSRHKPTMTNSSDSKDFDKKGPILNPSDEKYSSKSKDVTSYEDQRPSISLGPLNISYCLGNESINNCIGSEDLIIHDSEEDEDINNYIGSEDIIIHDSEEDEEGYLS
ncbi:hypothetical protein K3495_g8046 [Podosphaera aphanis]|nr:hypothetical protein K3495_g8046 [Podosphaera aphanis]